MLEKKYSHLSNYDKLIIMLSLLLIITTSFGTIFNFIFNVRGIHLINAFVLGSITLMSYKYDSMKLNKRFIPVVIYIVLVIIGVLLQESTLLFKFEAISYRITFPILFLLVFSKESIIKNLKTIGYSFIIITNISTIIISLFAIIEKVSPDTIYALYTGNITSHTTLIINGEIVVRLFSVVRNPINLGFYMAIGIASSLVIILHNWKKNSVLILLEMVAIPIFIYVMFYTYSRSAILVTGIAVLAIVITQLESINWKLVLLTVLIFVILIMIISTLFEDTNPIIKRLGTINFNSYFSNNRFKRTISEFDKDISILQIVFGHGIYKVNDSNAYLFELGYGSIIYESGVIGLIVVVGSFISSAYWGLKNILYKKITKENKSIYIFFVSIILSGLSAMFVQDIYMQQPFSLFIWLSVAYLISFDSELTIKTRIYKTNQTNL